MKRPSQPLGISEPRRVASIILATLAGLALTLTIVTAQQQPDFSTSYKAGPRFARPGDVITYTIVTVNTGEAAQSVVLSDALPGGVSFVPNSCAYDDGEANWDCGPLHQIWSEYFSTGKQITTTFAVTVTTSTLRIPLVNHAFLRWNEDQAEMIFTTTLLPAVPDFSASYKVKESPQIVQTGDVITYAIVAVNGGDPVTDVVLSDPLPAGVSFVGCKYDVGDTVTGLPCAPPPTLWEEDMDAGTRITTILAVHVETTTPQLPLRNCASLSWDILQEDVCATTTVNSNIYLPLVVRNDAPFANGDFADRLSGWSTGGALRVEAVTGLYAGALPPSISGAHAARLGGDDFVYPEGQVPIGYGALWQTFSVPAISNPEVTIRYRVATHDVVYGTTTDRYFDDFEVAIDLPPWEISNDSVRDAAGCNQSSPVPPVIDVAGGGLAFCDGNRTDDPTGMEDLYDTGWHTVTLRLGPSLSGTNITLYMTDFNRWDHNWNTWTYVDWVSTNW